jgi:hypothetical protein
MDIKQLLTVGDSTNPSSSQLWFHLVNIAVISIYVLIGYKVSVLLGTSPNPSSLIDSLVWLTAVISGIITGNKIANVVVQTKTGKKDASPTD